MKPNISRSRPSHGCGVRSHVVGWAACRIALAQLPQLRGQPISLQGAPLAPALLKHADGQTVAGLTAVSRALGDHGLKGLDFTGWGAIASPRYLGRATLAVALTRFTAEGAWGISPHLIPHHSLHALSGTVSQALKLHGPNYGVGGGFDGAAEALMAAGAILADRDLPGLWVILTGFVPELVPADPLAEGAPAPVADCLAVALALVPSRPGQHGIFLTVGAPGPADREDEERHDFSLEDFGDVLSKGLTAARWHLPCGGWASWDHAKADVEICL